METIKIWSDAPSMRQAEEIAAVLEAGRLAIIPTDSVYGIACDALNPKAVAELCRIKRIDPDKNNLSVICASISMAAEYAHIDDTGFRLLKDYTPGPFTFLFRAGRNLPKAFKGRKTVGIRIPDCATARMTAEALGHPVMVTSIEFSNPDEAREPGLIAERYGRLGVALTVDAGAGEEEYSTIVDCTGSVPVVTREGKGEISLDS